MKMRYRHAIEWIALNDEPTELDPEVISNMLTVTLIADLSGKKPLEVAKDIIEFRRNNEYLSVSVAYAAKREVDTRCFVQNIIAPGELQPPNDAWIEKCAECSKGPFPISTSHIVNATTIGLDDHRLEAIICENCGEET